MFLIGRKRKKTREMVADWVKQRRNKCDICQRDMGDKAHVDHNHVTGIVRGMLCGPCNRGIGLLNDSPEQCVRARHYLCA